MAKNKNVIGPRLRAARKEVNMSQQVLGRKLGFSHSTIGAYERGRLRVPSNILAKIADILKKPVSYFYGDYPKYSIERLEQKLDRIIEIREESEGYSRRTVGDLLQKRGLSKKGVQEVKKAVSKVCKREKVKVSDVWGGR